MQSLGTLRGPSVARGINDAGEIVGDFNSGSEAFLYSNGTMNALGTLGGPSSVAFCINSLGQIAGASITSGYQSDIFLYSDGSMQDLGAGDAAFGINDSGQIVGDTGESGNTAFLYSNGTMYDLNTLIPANSGWKLQQARAINDSGQICGIGFTATGIQDGFLLTPTSTPEPSALAILGVGSIGLLAHTLRRRKNRAVARQEAGSIQQR